MWDVSTGEGPTPRGLGGCAVLGRQVCDSSSKAGETGLTFWEGFAHRFQRLSEGDFQRRCMTNRGEKPWVQVEIDAG